MVQAQQTSEFRKRRCMFNRLHGHFMIKAAMFIILAVLTAGCAQSKESFEKEEAYRTIGIKAMEDGDYARAMEAFNSALVQASEIGPNEIDICFYKAAAQFASGSYHDAIETYNLLLESDDKNSDAYFLRGCVWLKANESNKAREDYDKAIEYAENDEIYLMIYNSLNAAGYELEAKEYLDEALEKRTGRKAENYTVKGKIYYLEGKLEEAVEYLVKAIDKGDVEANLYLARTYEAMQEDAKAESCINAYIEENPKSSVAYNQFGCKELEEGNFEKAVSFFEQGLALEKVTNEQELRSNLIAACELSGDFESAREKMREYIKDYPMDSAAEREYLFLEKNRNEETEKE